MCHCYHQLFHVIMKRNEISKAGNLTLFFFSASRHLAGEVAKEWQEVEENDKTQQETLLKLVKEIVPYNMAHNAEHEACDLLMEIERLDMLEDYIDENAYGKVCLYLTR